jgi:hypothetical protein
MFRLSQKNSAVPNGPDFSTVDSQAKVEQMFRRGELEKLFLMPLEFGGPDIPPNCVYVPIGFAKVKSDLDHNVIVPLFEAGKATQYSASPEYQGKSFVPSVIRVVASDPQQFTSVIKIWGDALQSNH